MICSPTVLKAAALVFLWLPNKPPGLTVPPIICDSTQVWQAATKADSGHNVFNRYPPLAAYDPVRDIVLVQSTFTGISVRERGLLAHEFTHKAQRKRGELFNTETTPKLEAEAFAVEHRYEEEHGE